MIDATTQTIAPNVKKKKNSQWHHEHRDFALPVFVHVLPTHYPDEVMSKGAGN
jgi:hypothetical protein